MTKTTRGFTKGPEFRQQEEKLPRSTQRDVAATPVTEVQQLVHKLQDHEIELDMQDVELRHAQLEIERVRDRYMELYDFAPAGHLTLDMGCTIVEANLKAGTLLDVTRKELIGQPFTRFLASDDHDVFHRHCREVVLKTGMRQSCEVRLQDKAGATAWVQLESLAIHDESGPITHWRTALLDITERKRDEQAKSLLIRDLRRSQQHFQTLFNWTPSAVGISTVAEGRFIDVNEAFSRLTEYKREEVIGLTTVELGLWADPSERTTVLREVQEQGSVHNREWLLRTKSGEIRALMVSVESIQLGSTPCLIYVAHDITERKRTEEALRTSEERFRAIMDNSPALMFLKDVEGRYLLVNRKFEETFHLANGDLIGKTDEDIFPPERAAAFHVNDRKVLEAGKSMEFEEVALHDDGLHTSIVVKFPLVNPQGRCYALCGIVTDITERKRAAAQLQETLIRLQNLSHRLDVVREEERTRIARELHDELGVRLTCLKMDLARIPSLVSRHRIEEKVRAMTTEVDRTIASVQRLVTELRPGILDDLGLVAAIEWQCQDFQRRSGIRCLCETSCEEIRLDSSRTTAAFRICQEALTNVLRHAEATVVTVRLDQKDGRLLLAIHDNGRGIAPDKWSGSQSFGLMGMRERAGAVGGHVQVAGESGVGTTVTLEVPMANS